MVYSKVEIGGDEFKVLNDAIETLKQMMNNIYSDFVLF